MLSPWFWLSFSPKKSPLMLLLPPLDRQEDYRHFGASWKWCWRSTTSNYRVCDKVRVPPITVKWNSSIIGCFWVHPTLISSCGLIHAFIIFFSFLFSAYCALRVLNVIIDFFILATAAASATARSPFLEYLGCLLFWGACIITWVSLDCAVLVVIADSFHDVLACKYVYFLITKSLLYLY